jgi:hypothetical protein
MKRLLPLLLLGCISVNVNAQGICNEAGNLIIYSNYDGEDLIINIDENIPDIKIGLCSYESMFVEITGPYAGNVTEVVYAGYDDDGTTSVDGVDPGIVDIRLYPAVTLDDPDGYGSMICAYNCDSDFVPGGCNTVDQLTDYFVTEWPDAPLRFSQLQYGSWGGSTFDISDGGNCCFGADEECFIDIEAGKDAVICEGESDILIVTGGDEYSWFPETGIDCVEPCSTVTVSPTETTEYIVTGFDADGCFGSDTVVVFVNESPDVTISLDGTTLSASGGVTYIWLQDGVEIPGSTGPFYEVTETGNYSVIAISAQGCTDTSDVIIIEINPPQGINDTHEAIWTSLFPNPAKDQLSITIDPVWLVESVSVMGTDGRVMIQEKTGPFETFTLSLTGLPAGMYLLQLQNNEGENIQRLFIKE